MNFSKQELLEIETELKEGYQSFFDFSLKLLETLKEKNNNLKFAVVNMQISLELFLKYYMVRSGEPEKIFVLEKGKKKYKDSSAVVSLFFSSVRWSYMKKKHLDIICETRNAIVHRGKMNEWNDQLAEYIILCAFFIQGTLKEKFGDTIFKNAYLLFDNKLSLNYTWRKGAEKFAQMLSIEMESMVLNCPHCEARALIDKDIFCYEETGTNGYQCLACFIPLDTEFQVNIIDCCKCLENTFCVGIDIELELQKHPGLCLNCGIKNDVRKCAQCDTYYFPYDSKEVCIGGNYYCSKNCFDLMNT